MAEAWSRRLDALIAGGIPEGAVRFSAAFGRSFGYYDGVLFEVRSEALGADQPVAAGGRYDGWRSAWAPRLRREPWGAWCARAAPGPERRRDERTCLAIPSKGRLKDQVEAWLADCGLNLRMAGGVRGYAATLDGFPDLQVRLASAGDIAEGLLAGEFHLGITGEDLLREAGTAMEARVMLLVALGFGRADLVVAAPKSWIDVETMADVDDVEHLYLARTGQRLRVATRPGPTRRFLRPPRDRRLSAGRERRRHRRRAGGGNGGIGRRHHQHRRDPRRKRFEGS